MSTNQDGENDLANEGIQYPSLNSLRLRVVVIAAAVASALLSGYLGYAMLVSAKPVQEIPSFDKVPDNLVLDRASSLEEVKTFKEKYPEFQSTVIRASNFAALYYIEECILKQTPCIDNPSIVEPYVGLRVRLDGEGFPTSSALFCITDSQGMAKFEQDIILHLEDQVCKLRTG